MVLFAPILAAVALLGGGSHATPQRATPVVSIDPARVAEIRLVERNTELVHKGLRRAPGAVYRANSKRVCRVYLTHRDCWLKYAHREHRRAEQGSLSAVDVAWAEANRIDAAGVSYLWGGGHVGYSLRGTPVTGMDCSGSVARVLGVPAMVSGLFTGWGKPGADPAGITVYANAGHVLMSIRGRFFGTSHENPGGGPGWIGPRGAGYLAGFVARHA